jgi:excisionase family DNA binding protein
MTETPSEFLTTTEVAARLRVNVATVRRMITAGQLPAVRAGKQYRVERDAVDAAISSWRTSTPITKVVTR